MPSIKKKKKGFAFYNQKIKTKRYHCHNNLECETTCRDKIFSLCLRLQWCSLSRGVITVFRNTESPIAVQGRIQNNELPVRCGISTTSGKWEPHAEMCTRTPRQSCACQSKVTGISKSGSLNDQVKWKLLTLKWEHDPLLQICFCQSQSKTQEPRKSGFYTFQTFATRI